MLVLCAVSGIYINGLYSEQAFWVLKFLYSIDSIDKSSIVYSLLRVSLAMAASKQKSNLGFISAGEPFQLELGECLKIRKVPKNFQGTTPLRFNIDTIPKMAVFRRSHIFQTIILGVFLSVFGGVTWIFLLKKQHPSFVVGK